MTPQEIQSLITSVGFPIVMCGALAWYVKHLTDKFNEALNKIREQHDEEAKAMIKSLDSNTLAINTLSERLKDVDR